MDLSRGVVFNTGFTLDSDLTQANLPQVSLVWSGIN